MNYNSQRTQRIHSNDYCLAVDYYFFGGHLNNTFLFLNVMDYSIVQRSNFIFGIPHFFSAVQRREKIGRSFPLCRIVIFGKIL